MNLHDPALTTGERHRAVPVRPPGRRHVAILMGVRDGATFLEEQLASIAGQEHDDWSLIVSDDGSRDGSIGIVQRFATANPARTVRLISGPQAGFPKNYLGLLRGVPDTARFVAFADQDDVWLRGRLVRGLEVLSGAAEGVPALYGARTILTDAALGARGLSPRFRRPPSFANALVQSIAGGNTMLMNRAAADLLVAAAARTESIVSHDWWAYQIVSGAGGRVFYDERATVLYRQHGGNLVGAGAGLCAKARRLRGLFGGTMRAYNDTNLEALAQAAPLLTPENRRLVEILAHSRLGGLPARLTGLRKAGLYRQTLPGTIALWAAAVLGRL